MKKKMNDSGKSKLVLTILTAVCVVLIILSFTTDAVSGPLHYVTGVITPIQSGMNAIGTWISDKGEYLFHTTDLRSENAGLQKKVDELTAERKQTQTTFDWTAPVGGGQKKETDIMNALIRGALK